MGNPVLSRSLGFWLAGFPDSELLPKTPNGSSLSRFGTGFAQAAVPQSTLRSGFLHRSMRKNDRDACPKATKLLDLPASGNL
jgi:hypothetical protein